MHIEGKEVCEAFVRGWQVWAKRGVGKWRKETDGFDLGKCMRYLGSLGE
jgi:hypothetical protein